MNWHDLIALLGVLICGFWKIHQELTGIREAISLKVTYADCSQKRQQCPLVERVERLERREEQEG